MHNLFKKYRNSINKTIKVSKAKPYHQYFNINKRNLLKVWEGIKENIHSKPNTGQTVNSLRTNGSLSTNQNQIANSLNAFFCNVPKEIRKKLIPATTSFSCYLADPAKNSLFMRPTNEKEIEQKIKAMKDNKALGPNSIRTKILKVHSKTLSKLLAELINLSLNQGKFPAILKIVKVITIHKRGDKGECDNYRPISLISNISKLIEKTVHERLYSFLEKEQLLFEGQFRFRNNRSTADALIDITERIRDARDKDLNACGAFLDFKKAFDAVNHDILLSKLAHYGIRGQVNNWFHSYLTQRVQFTSANRFNSRPYLFSYGVPQRSVLGPLLFIIFINDLHKSVRHIQMIPFADDKNLLYINKSMKKINKHFGHDFSFICQWLRANKISLNAGKTELVIFSPKRKQITMYLNFRISISL